MIDEFFLISFMIIKFHHHFSIFMVFFCIFCISALSGLSWYVYDYACFACKHLYFTKSRHHQIHTNKNLFPWFHRLCVFASLSLFKYFLFIIIIKSWPKTAVCRRTHIYLLERRMTTTTTTIEDDEMKNRRKNMNKGQ